MAIAKWSMYLTAVLFVLIGAGALAVAVLPGADEWFAEQVLDRAGVPDDAFGDQAVSLVADSEGVQLSAWIFVITFLPTAALFVWVGRWFKSMEGGASPMFGARSTPLTAAPMPTFGDATPEPSDPTAGGIIS